jgi:hypothetical protein
MWSAAATAAVVLLGAATLHYAYRAQQAEERLERLLASTQTDATNGASSPRFIAVRTHAAGCPMCERTLAAFEALRKEFANAGVVFVTFEVASPDDQHVTESLARALGVEWALPACENCCAVRLLDREAECVVATQQAFEETDVLRAELRKAEAARDDGAARPKG